MWICPNVLHYEYLPPENAWINAWARVPAPDVMMYGRQDFANRVGFWRMLEAVDRHGMRCTAVLNAEALIQNPSIRDAMVERDWDYLGHGINNTRFVHGLAGTEEAAYYRRMRQIVHEQTGKTLKGTGGPGPQAATENTPDILAQLGFTYHSDWFHDDMPTPLRVRSGRLISMPYAMDINDSPFLGSAFEAEDFVDMVKRHFDVLYREGEHSGKVMCVSLHPSLFGQAHRIKYLEEIFEYLRSYEGVWHATGSEISDHYMAHCYDNAMAYLNGVGQ
ncbi:polysaccharide deacetylase [Pusillimonas noertemannii]|uniref:polysaccharide deacetylase n=1 Tax=Pusillimonas noertemannii TaxID=305977 RepID=UPI001403A28C|nr:polysaccharide deacetylase [Pusillimonas noertemannii]NYT69189.1 polysaccharide deacetylase [Pusillimonas noertemannii]